MDRQVEGRKEGRNTGQKEERGKAKTRKERRKGGLISGEISYQFTPTLLQGPGIGRWGARAHHGPLWHLVKPLALFSEQYF